MLRHLITGAIVAFWITMSGLLWYNEYGPGRQLESQIPLDSVIQRILNAADPSTLRLTHQGQDIGQLRWVPTILESPREIDPARPDGMVADVEGYRLDLDLVLTGSTPDTRWRVLAEIQLGPDRLWRQIQIRLIQRPSSWELIATATDDSLLITPEEGHEIRFQQRIHPSDFNQVRSLLGPLAPLLPSGLFRSNSNSPPHSLIAPWIARNDSFDIGRHRVRAYRLSTRLLDQFEIVAHFSRAGELLRVSFPDQYLLTSSALPTAPTPAKPNRQ
jgi:hypothetical protein